MNDLEERLNELVAVLLKERPEILNDLTDLEVEAVIKAYAKTLIKSSTKKPLYLTDFNEWMRQEEIIHPSRVGKTNELLELINNGVNPFKKRG